MQEKLPPHDVDAEEATLGSLLIDPEAIFKVATFLKKEDFFVDINQWVYQACLSLYQRPQREAINQITVAHELMQEGLLEQAGGVAYLSHLISIVPTSLHIEHYAEIVSRMATMRRLIDAAGEIATIGYNADSDIDGSLNKAEDILFKVKTRRSTQDFVTIREALGQYFDNASRETALQAGEIPNILTGFTALDDFLGGLQRSDLIVLAARPSVGKTSLALNIARNAAINQQACVTFFSLEMSRESVVQRCLASESEVDLKKIRSRDFNGQDEIKIVKASGILSEAPIYIDDSPQMRIMDIRSKARRLWLEHGINLIIIDYLQLIQGEDKKQNRVQTITEITGSLKMLARELNVPVLVMSQLNRAVEGRTSHIPQLSDLRESGSIEQDADVVLFINRDEMNYKPDEWSRLHDIDMEPYPQGISDVIISKHRNGPLGQVKLRFLDKIAKFDNLKAQPLSTS